MNSYIELINKKLDEFIPVQYPESIFKSMKYTALLPGKRLRPVMCLESCRIFGGNIEDAIPTACAIEMLHAQSLIHDDLPCMDNDDFRRGKLTNHKVFGEATAVLAGDALLTFAPQLIIEKSNLPARTTLRIVEEYCKAAGAYGLVAGQIADILSEGSENPEAPAVLEFIQTNKTAVLFKLALRTGAVIAGADEAQLAVITGFGQKFGIAFQIADDILDETSTFARTGKTSGKDKDAQKLTAVSLYGLDGAKEKLTALVSECFTILKQQNIQSEIFTRILNKISIEPSVRD
ncbi:MAG: polyprenyl synthetase family protein [Heliobacteriaceae bacterium]|nr:polyprenyl synthetase family protein [Heliobacteriaceae bacterium]